MRRPGKICMFLLLLLMQLSVVTAYTAYSQDFEGSESWSCFTNNQGLDTCTTDANDYYSSPDESLKAHRNDGVCGKGGVARDFSFSSQPETLNVEIKAKSDNWGRNTIMLEDSSGYHVLWRRKASGSSYETGWMSKSFDISDYDSSFRLIFGNDDNSWACDNGDHTWWLWADDISVDVADSPPNQPANPSPSNNSVFQSKDRQISAYYTDPDGDSGTLHYWTGNEKIGSCSVNSGNRCSVSWSINHGNNYWFVNATDSTGAESDLSNTWNIVHNNAPDQTIEPETPSDGETIYGTSTGLEMAVSDPDNDPLSTEFRINGSSPSFDRKLSGSEPAQTTVSGLKRGLNYEWYGQVSDEWEATESTKWFFHVNNLSNIVTYSPAENSVVSGETAELEVVPADEESEDITVYFFSEDDSLLGKQTVQDGFEASTEWSRLEIGKEYSWYVKLDDGSENYTSKTFSFNRFTSGSYRVENTIKYEYTGVIVPVSAKRIVPITVENRLGQSKQVKTYVSGPGASFSDGSASRTYRLGPYESRDFDIHLNPTSPGTGSLEISTRDMSIGINSTTSMPVYVRDYPAAASGKEVPGVSAVQLVFILAFSTIFYFFR